MTEQERLDAENARQAAAGQTAPSTTTYPAPGTPSAPPYVYPGTPISDDEGSRQRAAQAKHDADVAAGRTAPSTQPAHQDRDAHGVLIAPLPAQTRRYLDHVKNPRRRSTDAALPAPPKLYPAARYHKTTGDSQLVKDEAHDKSLGSDWSDKPPVASPWAAGWRYHAKEQPKFVNTKAEDDALGPGWFPTVQQAAASTKP